MDTLATIGAVSSAASFVCKWVGKILHALKAQITLPPSSEM